MTVHDEAKKKYTSAVANGDNIDKIPENSFIKI